MNIALSLWQVLAFIRSWMHKVDKFEISVRFQLDYENKVTLLSNIRELANNVFCIFKKSSSERKVLTFKIFL